jgi:hypothetical protein
MVMMGLLSSRAALFLAVESHFILKIANKGVSRRIKQNRYTTNHIWLHVSVPSG